MKHVFLQKGKVSLQEVPTPSLNKNGVLVKVHYSFISSGTEVATLRASEKSLVARFAKNSSNNIKKVVGAFKDNGFSGTVSLIKGKLNSFSSLGYSCSGQVAAVGSKVEKFKVGDFVACAGSGFANHAQVVSVPANLVVKISDHTFLKQASLTTIGAVAMQGVRRATLSLGEKVCVLGLGLIGQITVQLAKLAGCQVFGVDLNQDRLKLAQTLGADYVFNSNLIDAVSEIDFVTNHYGVDSTIITAASNSGQVIQQAMNVTRRKGRVVLVGDAKIDFDRDPFYSKEIDFLISCSYGPGRYDAQYEQKGIDYPYSYVRWTQNRNMELFLELIEKKKISVDSLISQNFELDDVESAYNYLKKNKALGIVLSYINKDDKNNLEELTKELTKSSYQEFYFNVFDKDQDLKALPYIAEDKSIKTGFIGAGGFAKIKLLPILSKSKRVEIHSIVDTDSANLLNIAKLYGAKRFANNYRTLFANDDIKLVVIATPHKFHFEQSIAALKAGKAVFVEKPAVVTFDQLKILKEFFRINKNSLYCVDFNRSFALFNLAIKKELHKRKSPAIINYRMNAGFIPKDHWIQNSKNGGRIIGEACHIFELFCFLTDAKPVSVSVESLNHKSDGLLSNDNVVVGLRMDDGSCCSLIYSAIGNKAMGKEQMEIFFDGKSIVMQDYKKLKGYGLPTSFNKRSRYPDKGHEKLLSEFIKAAKTPGLCSPISLERIFAATHVSLIANKLALAGGGRSFVTQTRFAPKVSFACPEPAEGSKDLEL